MKIKRNFISLILSFGFLFQIVGCNTNNSETPSTSSGDNIQSGVEESNPNHDVTISETNDYLLKNGTTEYSLLLPAEPTVNERIAADEFNLFFKEATGKELTVVYDDSYDSTKKYVSIGQTVIVDAVSSELKLEVLGSDGVRVLTKDKNIICCGLEGAGTINSVYELLHQTLNYEYVGQESYTLNTGVKDIQLMNYDIVDVPDIPQRTTGYGFVTDNDVSLRRLKLSSSWDSEFISVDGVGRIHNSLDYFKDETDSDYFATSEEQICFSAHGNQEKLTKMISLVGNKMIDALKKSPSANIFEFTQMDNANWCKCKTCKDYAEEYGTDSAVVIIFMNQLNSYIKAWMSTEEGLSYKKDYKLAFFAYMSTENAPVKEVNGEFVPISEEIVCDPELAVIYAPITVDYTVSIKNNINKAQYETMKKWKAVCSNMILWLYGTNFRDYFVPYDITNSIQDSYKFAVEANAITVFNQAQFYQTGSATGWQVLSSYLDSKYAWNKDYNLNELIETFIDGYFGEAADVMRKYFDEYRQHMFNLQQSGLYGGLSSIYIDTTKDSKKELRYPEGLMRQWMNYCDEAMESISWLEHSNFYRYNLLTKHIKSERLFPMYILSELYENSFSKADLLTLRTTIKEDVNMLGMTSCREHRNMTELFSKWGM